MITHYVYRYPYGYLEGRRKWFATVQHSLNQGYNKVKIQEVEGGQKFCTEFPRIRDDRVGCNGDTGTCRTAGTADGLPGLPRKMGLRYIKRTT